ncbi:MAG TPA: hypothetical protein VMT30_00120 [Candidatus Saccharimonadia bacterium]|nr:hypothetical protein [Candidatus Saccharimonadia bacterium]
MITKQRVRLGSLALPSGWGLMLAAFELLAVYGLGRQSGWWWLAVVVVAAVELRSLRPGVGVSDKGWVAMGWERVPGFIMGISITLIMVLAPRLATQVVVAMLYAMWLGWRALQPAEHLTRYVNLLLVQAVMFEAIFLMAAIWQTPGWLILGLIWLGSYSSVYATLRQRADRSAGVMAATWGVIATEVAWVLSLWLITYTMRGGYVLVPQPALILTALGYVFGSILASSREGNLSRARLAEYLVIALVLVAIVVAGTSWRGNS